MSEHESNGNGQTPLLDRASFLGRRFDLRRETVEVPDLGGLVGVRMLTGAERDRFEIQVSDSKRQNFRGRLVAFTVCDATGRRLFTDADVPALGELPASVLSPIADVALRLNGFTAADVEELEKNSERDPSGGLPSGSPRSSE